MRLRIGAWREPFGCKHMIETLRENPYPRSWDESAVQHSLQRLARWDEVRSDESHSSDTVDSLTRELRLTMQKHCGVYRNRAVLEEGLAKLGELAQRLEKISLGDTSRIFNTARIEALELENLMLVARATLVSALAREESRGAHTREDFPQREDDKWLKHSLYSLAGDQLDYKPVRLKPLSVGSFKPKERTY